MTESAIAPRPPTIRVVLGEDNFLTREAIQSVLSSVEEIELVAECEDLDSLRTAIDELRPDAVVTDIRMPPSHTDEGTRLAAELRSTHPEIGVVVLSQHAEPVYVTSLFEEGSAGRAYLLKERVSSKAELVRAVRTVVAGGSVVDPLVVERLITADRDRERSRLSNLTPSELKILALIAEGYSNGAIAKARVISKRAVERHINSIFSKLDLREADDISRRVKATLLYLSAGS